MKVLSTTDYSIFKHHPKNRTPLDVDVSRLIRSIQMRNMLEFRPILVDSLMRVVDGNHRLAAAKKLSIPIFYTIDPNCVDEDMITFNQASTPWKYQNYLDFYVNSGNPDYIALKAFCDENHLSLYVALKFMQVGCASRKGDGFKEGKFRFNHMEAIELKQILVQVEEVKSFLEMKKNRKESFIRGNNFTKGLVEFFSNKSVDFDILMSKLPFKMNLLKPCTTSSEFVQLLQTIYNHNNRKPIDVLSDDQR